jgi:hypothetical protein
LLRASTPTSVELDSQLFLTDNHILFRFNAMTLLSAVGIDVIGSWFAAEGLPTGLAVLDTVGLPGSALVSYLTAQRHMTTTQPLFASFLTGETVSVDEPISQIRGTRHVRTYHVTANASAFASMIAQQLRMRGGLLLPAESTVNQITNIFTTMQSDITVDAVTGLPIEMKLNLRGVTATGAPMTFDATITFTDAPTLVVIDEPIATNTLEQLVGIILKTLEQVPEGGL